MDKTRDRVLLEFDQLLNFLFRTKGNDSLWLCKERVVEGALNSFCRDAQAVVPRSELHSYAKENWLRKTGLEKRPEVAVALRELLETQIPLA